MKKKLLSLFLILALVVGMVPVSNAAILTDYGMKLNGVSQTTNGNGILFTFQAKGPKTGFANGTAGLTLCYDPTKLTLVKKNGTALTAQPGSSFAGVTGGGSYDMDNWDYIQKATVMGKSLSANKTILSFQPQFTKELAAADYTDLMWVRFNYASGVTKGDIDSTAIWIATAEEAGSVGSSNVAVIPSQDAATNGSKKVQYGVVSGIGSGEENLAKPKIYIDDTEVPGVAAALTGLTVTLSNSTAAITNSSSVNVTASAAPVPSDADKGTITWSIDPAVTGVSINASTGAITVASSASAGTANVKATSSKGQTGSAILTITKAAAATNSVALSPTSATVTLNADGSAPASTTVSVTVKDQYNATMTGKTPTVTGLPAGATWNSGKIDYTNALRAGTSTVKFDVDGKSANFSLTVNKAAGPAAPSTPVGVPVSAVGATDGKITGVSTAMEYAVGSSTTYTACTGTEITGLGAGTYKVRMKVDSNFQNNGLDKTVTISAPGASAVPSVAITGAASIKEGESTELTANVTGNNGGSVTYKWFKDGAQIAGQTTSKLTVNEAGSYVVKVINQETGKAPSTEVASAAHSVTVAAKPVVAVALNATATAATNNLTMAKLVTVTPVAGMTAADIVSGKATFNGTDTWTDAKGIVSAKLYKVEEADGAKTYTLVNNATLTEGDYVADVAVAAVTDKDAYAVNAKAFAGAPTDPITAANYVTLKLTKASAGGIGGGGSATSTYLVTYEAGENGKIVSGSTTERVIEGDKPANVPTVKANDGYKFVGWTLNGSAVKPNATVITSSVKFVAAYESVSGKACYIQGIGNNVFGPSMNATRGQLAAMLARLSKTYEEGKTYTGNAPDVSTNAWYTDVVNFAIQQGIMNGFEDGSFRPTANITRGEFAAMLARFMGVKEAEGSRFVDMNGHWASGYVNALAQSGIVDGFKDGTFKANDLLTRSQAVKMINLAIGMKYDPTISYGETFNDVASGAWYYEYVMPAANLDVKPYQK